MPLPSEPAPNVTLPEYLRAEATASERHEYHDGRVLAMSGGSRSHARITTNLTSALNPRLGDGPCEVFDSNLRVAAEYGNRFVYPDASIACGENQFHPDDPNQTTLTNPRLIFEVLSDSTEAYDRGDKFLHYRQIPSLEEYVLLSQREPLVESFWRQPDGAWAMLSWLGLDATVSLRSIAVTLPLSELYRGISFEAAE